MSDNARIDMQRSQLLMLLFALDELRNIYPTSVEDYCNGVLAIARAIGLPTLITEATK